VIKLEDITKVFAGGLEIVLFPMELLSSTSSSSSSSTLSTSRSILNMLKF
jgi:hypothetical protein